MSVCVRLAIKDWHRVDAPKQFYLKGYRVVSCFSHSRHTGGVAVYARSDIAIKVIFNESLEGNWFLGAAVSRGRLVGNYGIIYHSPSASDSRLVEILEDWLDRFLDFRRTSVIVGDFNIDWLNIEKSAKLKSLMDSVNMKQKVTEVTRVTLNLERGCSKR